MENGSGDTINLSAKMWQEGTPHPDAWGVQTTIDDATMYSTSGRFGIYYHTFKHRQIFTDNFETDVLQV